MLIVSNHIKKVKFLPDTVYFLFIVLEGMHHVANIHTYCINRKNGYYVIYHPSICKYCLQLILFQFGVGT